MERIGKKEGNFRKQKIALISRDGKRWREMDPMQVEDHHAKYLKILKNKN